MSPADTRVPLFPVDYWKAFRGNRPLRLRRSDSYHHRDSQRKTHSGLRHCTRERGCTQSEDLHKVGSWELRDSGRKPTLGQNPTPIAFEIRHRQTSIRMRIWTTPRRCHRAHDPLHNASSQPPTCSRVGSLSFWACRI